MPWTTTTTTTIIFFSSYSRVAIATIDFSLFAFFLLLHAFPTHCFSGAFAAVA